MIEPMECPKRYTGASPAMPAPAAARSSCRSSITAGPRPAHHGGTAGRSGSPVAAVVERYRREARRVERRANRS